MSTSTTKYPAPKKQVSLPSAVESLDKVEKFVNDVLSYENVDEVHIGNILVSVTEGANNAINHGNNGKASIEFKLSYGVDGDTLFFTVSDNGSGFDHEKIPDPTLPDNVEKVSGRGVFIMKSLADDVHFEENGSTVIIQFNHVINAS